MFGFGIYIYIYILPALHHKQLMQLLKSPSRKNAPNFNLIKSKYYPINKIIFYQIKKKIMFTIFLQQILNSR